MKVINSINYNTPVKNVLYETLNNRNEVKKDSVLISKPEVNHEVVNVTISNVSVNTVTSEQLRRVGATVEMFLKRGVSTEALSERLRLNQDNIIERMAIHDELQVNEVRWLHLSRLKIRNQEI